MTKRTFQKMLALSLAGVLAMGSLTACGKKSNDEKEPAVSNNEGEKQNDSQGSTNNGGNSGTTTVAGIDGWSAFDKNVTITVPVYDRGKAGYLAVDDNYWTKYVQSEFGDKYNITVKYAAIPRGDVMTKYSMLIAAKQTPTILMEYDYPKVTQWANDGAMQTIDLNAFAQVAPTYYQKMVDNNQLNYTDVNGETYFVLSERPYYNTPYTFVEFVRLDWLKQVGYDYVPEDYDEWKDAVDKIVAAGLTNLAPINFSLPSQAYIANFGFRDFPANEEEWVMHSSLGTPCFAWEPTYRMIKRQNIEYHDGWYSKEFDLDLQSTVGSQAETDFVNGKLLSFSGYMSPNVTWLNSFYENNPNAELAVKTVTVDAKLDGEYQKTVALRADNPFGMIIGFSSLATEDELKAAWMYMEWMCQEKNLFVMENGIEGVNFNYNENGIAEQINLEGTGNEMMMNHNSNIDMTCIVRASKKVGNTIEDAIKAISPQGLPQDFTQQLIDNYYAQKQIADKGLAYSDPIFAVAIEEESEYSAALLSLYQEYFAKLIKCDTKDFDALYNEYKQAYLDAGYQEIIDARLDAYKAGKTTKLPDNSK